MVLELNWDETHLIFNKDELKVGEYLMSEDKWKALVSVCGIDHNGEPPKVISELKKKGKHGCFEKFELQVSFDGYTYELDFDYWPSDKQVALTFDDFAFGLDLEFIEKD